MTADPQWPLIVQGLGNVAAKPKKVTGTNNIVNSFQLMVDYLATVPPRMQKLTSPFRRYPSEFERVTVRARDGIGLSAWVGRAAREPRDGLVLIPGLYTSKDNPRIRARAVRILREWGFHVLALDLRGVGGSDRVPSTPGWKEAEDIIDAIAAFRRLAPVRRVHLYAESLAASAAIVAAGMEAQAGRKLLDGRVLAMSPYADAQRIIDLYSTPDPASTELGRDFVAVQKFFNGLLRLQGYKGGRFDAYIRHGADHYGTTYEELLRRSSPRNFIADANVPLLVIHSEDDGLVPVAEARRLAALAAGSKEARVWILPWGYHALYEMADPDWYWQVLGRVFGERSVEAAAPARRPPTSEAPRATSADAPGRGEATF